jgi:outer membrane receptor protein involved in Fe transport
MVASRSGLDTGPPSEVQYDPLVDAPNASAGFFDDLSGNELPNAPRWTFAFGGQYNFNVTRDWQATARVDYYWQDESFARIHNAEIDRLKSWSNTNLSFWVTNPVNGITVEAYVKNALDETPITGTFLNSDDSGLTTNVFTLDPRLIGVSIRKEF